jgi:hypothetical protein
MPLSVDLQNPPPWVVHVGHEPGVTMPFETRADAEWAYRSAVESGCFTHVIRQATKKKPALEVTLVSLWERATYISATTGKEGVHYVGCAPWHENPPAETPAKVPPERREP